MGENLSERNPLQPRNPYQWNTVTRKRTSMRKPQPALRTCFVDFIPTTINPSDILKTFELYGPISHIHIPPKLRQNRNHKYAFVQFLSSQSCLKAIQDENGRRLGGARLKVFPAKADNPPPIQKPFRSPNPSTHDPLNYQSRRTTYPSKPANRDHRSYKEACTNVPSPTPKPHSTKKPKTRTNHQFPSIQPDPIPDFCQFEPSRKRIMSSRALGENVELTRDSLVFDRDDEVHAAILKGSLCDDNAELFSRSVIGTSSSSLSSNDLLQLILSEGLVV